VVLRAMATRFSNPYSLPKTSLPVYRTMHSAGGFWVSGVSGPKKRKIQEMSPRAALSQAASFTDDTSLPRAGCHVSIHAQIIREHQINWYFFLKDRTPHDRGEFKDQVVNAFFALAESDREKVFRTLRTVRLHIVDPRPYALPLHDALQKHLPKGTNVAGFLHRLDASTRHLEHARRIALAAIAEDMLRDAPAERLKLEYRAWECSQGSTIMMEEGDFIFTDMDAEPAPAAPRFDLTPFQHRHSNLLNDVARFVSASASVFSPAIDEFEKAREDCFFASPMAGPWLINATLGRAHAFDEGHSHAVRWIEDQRDGVLSAIDRHRHFYPAFMPERLQELISTESLPIQAADIAASIARELWHRNSLPHLVRRFEYVTFNGERLSENRADGYEAIFRAIPSPN
jgi:hypothetical protein